MRGLGEVVGDSVRYADRDARIGRINAKVDERDDGDLTEWGRHRSRAQAGARTGVAPTAGDACADDGDQGETGSDPGESAPAHSRPNSAQELSAHDAWLLQRVHDILRTRGPVGWIGREALHDQVIQLRRNVRA